MTPTPKILTPVLATLLPTLLGVGVGRADAGERILTKTTVVQAPIEAVFDAWTSEEGLRFISQEHNVELEIGGRYEWFMDGPADERGRRGGEGARILSYVYPHTVAFTWTFPPAIPELRDADETTQVVVRLSEQDEGQIHVQLDMHGWQEGEAWDRGWDYFDSAWGYVLTSLNEHFQENPAPEPASETEKRWKTNAGVDIAVISGRHKRQEFRVDIDAGPDEVWNLIATEDGLTRLGARSPEVSLEIGGPYRFWSGATNTVMAWVPGEMLATSGSAPEQFPNVREGGTWSTMDVLPRDDGGTTLRMTLVGWRDGEKEWDEAFDYFLSANPVWMLTIRDVAEKGAGAGG